MASHVCVKAAIFGYVIVAYVYLLDIPLHLLCKQLVHCGGASAHEVVQYSLTSTSDAELFVTVAESKQRENFDELLLARVQAVLHNTGVN